MPTKNELSSQIAKLEHELAAERRALGAAHEWLLCEARGHATMTLDVRAGVDGATVLRVHVHGMGRASGGVAVVQIAGMDEFNGPDAYHDLPRYLDDLIVEWSHDSTREIRDAAKLLAARREEYNAIAKAG